MGTLKYLNRHGKLGEGTSDWETRTRLVLDNLNRAGGPWPRALGDHASARYLDALAKNL